MFRLVRGNQHILDVLDVLHRDWLALRIHDGAFSTMGLTARRPRTGDLLAAVKFVVQTLAAAGESPLIPSWLVNMAALALSAASLTGWSGSWLWHWALVEVLLRLTVGVAVGIVLGWLLGRLFFRARNESLRLAEHSEGFVAQGGLSALTWRGALLAMLLLLVIRPLIGYLAQPPGTRAPSARLVTAVFGIRGIGSFFYLAYALGHGEFAVEAGQLWAVVTFTVVVSVFLHGVAAAPVVAWPAGLITRAEWKAGRIDHALSFGTLRNDGRPVFPAVDSDGSGRGPWSQGQFIWLDPAYDIEADTSLAPYERVIAKALQEYGAFNVKNSGEFGFLSEYGSRPPGSGEGDHPSLSHIKFGKYLRAGTIKPAS
ncbi:hypothetical protein [Streptomyces sp. SCSIO ZS0520]|uniref:hypothetical protein n=1 Tax=Streptomyces sp. SCSIO ZS0520 TaxID=2892996 RepID=UPI0021DB354A|nr:hypothetical protein [Streptomyces sp. SCSIO ZS0520]